MQLVQPLLTSHVDDLPAEDHAESCTDRCGVPIAWKAYEIYELDLALLRFPQLVPSALFRPSLAASTPLQVNKITNVWCLRPRSKLNCVQSRVTSH